MCECLCVCVLVFECVCLSVCVYICQCQCGCECLWVWVWGGGGGGVSDFRIDIWCCGIPGVRLGILEMRLGTCGLRMKLGDRVQAVYE